MATERRKLATRISGGVVLALLLMQAVRFAPTNPPVTGEIQAPPEVKALLHRACYDCHSNETSWPWYHQVAPVSWLLHRDVVQGRRHVNFSEWSALPEEKKKKKQSSCAEEVESGDMPPWFYLPMHPAAHLTDAEKTALVAWGRGPVSP